MKILLHNHVPFMLAHGGSQTQIEQTKAGLEKVGVEVEYLRWYDGSQKGDVLHFFGRIPLPLMMLAHQKGMKVVLAELLTEQGSRSMGRLRLQRLTMRTIETLTPGLARKLFNWEVYRRADACVAGTAWEARLMKELFCAPPERIHVVPNGAEDIFLQSRPVPRGAWLVCTATITERKRVLELAEAAVRAQTPLWVVGKAYSDADPYARRFLELARREPKYIRFEGAIPDRSRLAAVYREARGFVLLSAMESLSLSAGEAAACQCPMLLSDLPWARAAFADSVSYCPLTFPVEQTALVLRRFYDDAPKLNPPPKPLQWTEVGFLLKQVYESCFNTSR
jgi:glycosyltransferase involved in cell wall biosynthesis